MSAPTAIGDPRGDSEFHRIGVGLGDLGLSLPGPVRDLTPQRHQVLDGVAGRNRHGSHLEHQLGRLLIESAAVFDRLDPGPGGRRHPGQSVAVGAHRHLGHGGLLDDGPQFLVVELPVVRMIELAHRAARGVDLDHLGPDPDLAPDGLDAFRHPVADGHPTHARSSEVVPPGLRHPVDVAVPGGGPERGACAVYVGSDQRSLVDQPPQVDTHPSHLAGAGEARHQEGVRVTGRPHCQHGQRGGGQLREIGCLSPEEVGMTVPHAGHHHRHVIDLAARGLGCIRPRPRVGDGLTVDHQAPVGHRISPSRNQQLSFYAYQARQPSFVSDREACDPQGFAKS